VFSVCERERYCSKKTYKGQNESCQASLESAEPFSPASHPSSGIRSVRPPRGVRRALPVDLCYPHASVCSCIACQCVCCSSRPIVFSRLELGRVRAAYGRPNAVVPDTQIQAVVLGSRETCASRMFKMDRAVEAVIRIVRTSAVVQNSQTLTLRSRV
jgi:hypothetical protein